MLQRSCCLSSLSKAFFLLPPQNLQAYLSSRISSNESQQVDQRLTKSKNCSLMSEEQEFKLDLPLCYLFRYFVQVWAGMALETVRESCSEVKLPLLDCKCTLGAPFCLPELSWLCSKGGGDTNSIAQQNNKRGDWHLLMNNYCLPHPFEQRHYHRAVHIYKAHWWAPQHHADLPERTHGAEKHLAFNQAGDWALQTSHTAELANSSSSGV